MWGKQHRYKKAYESELMAKLALLRLHLSENANNTLLMRAYWCTWGDTHEDRQAPLHWHFGHNPGSGGRSASKKPTP